MDSTPYGWTRGKEKGWRQSERKGRGKAKLKQWRHQRAWPGRLLETWKMPHGTDLWLECTHWLHRSPMKTLFPYSNLDFFFKPNRTFWIHFGNLNKTFYLLNDSYANIFYWMLSNLQHPNSEFCQVLMWLWLFALSKERLYYTDKFEPLRFKEN